VKPAELPKQAIWPKLPVTRQSLTDTNGSTTGRWRELRIEWPVWRRRYDGIVGGNSPSARN